MAAPREAHTPLGVSRDGPSKVYVQHRLAEQADRVWDLLQRGGHV